jgi:hypothetical protein
LRVQAKPERLVALLRAHQQLLTKIKTKRHNLERLGEKIRVAAVTTIAQLQPLHQEIEELDRQCHKLFAALLSHKPQPRSRSRSIEDLYLTLQRIGLLSWHRPAAPGSAKAGGAAQQSWDDDDDPAQPKPDGGGVSASRPGDGVAGQSVRRLFRKLAEALHPDKVLQEEEKERRTEAMKEITRAYQEGDLARLVELERAWLLDPAALPSVAAGDELDRRCATLEHTNAGLRTQLDALTRELKDLRRSPQAELLSHLESSARSGGGSPTDLLIQESQAQAAQLRELLRFVSGFRDGQIDLATFREGPDFLHEADTAEDDLISLLCELSPPPRRNKKRRSSPPQRPSY